jgi:hypothetical protein
MVIHQSGAIFFNQIFCPKNHGVKIGINLISVVYN